MIRSVTVVALLSLACYGGSLPADAPRDCGTLLDGRLIFQMESGVSGTCQSIGQQLLSVQTLFKAKFGVIPEQAPNISTTRPNPWTVLVEYADTVHYQGDTNFAGWSDFTIRRIYVSQYKIREVYAHEMYHALLGSESWNHGQPSWCTDLSPWELANGLEDERAYLGCGLH